MIPQDTIDRIREGVDIAQVISAYLKVKKRGRNFEALCPFHTEKTPSFKINVDRQIYHCFGCGKGGNVFTFLMEHERMSFVEAVKHLAPRANVVIREEKSDYRREELDRLSYAHELAVEYFQAQLFEPRYRVVLEDYLRDKRSISDESIEHFKLGLAGKSWDGFIKHATRKGLKEPDLVKAGLAVHNEIKGSYFDRFRERLMIPIFNLSQKPIGFGGRTLKKGEPAKYVNSPETPLYHKSNVLYALNLSRDAIRSEGKVIVVEGYFDVISLWQAGVHNVVASSGTAFTDQQARLLARFATDAFLFFDADSAGQQAALRSVDALYDAGLEVKVMIPPEGEDPDSIAREHGLEKIESLQQEALDYIPFRVRGVDLEGAGIIEREKLIKEMAALGHKIGDPTRRALFLQEAADALRVDRSLLTGISTGSSSDGTVGPTRSRHKKAEVQFLSLLLAAPGTIDRVFETISSDDFDSRQLARLYSAIATQYEMEGLISAEKLVEHLQDEESISLLTELASLDWPRESINHEMAERTGDFLKRKQKRIRSRLKADLDKAEAAGDETKAAEILEEMKQHGLI
ncbi:MAG: DNA primase [Candidatus Zixiibacteriota bacterium]|nr:MAG: DNA primase [candidate division Zixibacteria bacterium]